MLNERKIWFEPHLWHDDFVEELHHHPVTSSLRCFFRMNLCSRKHLINVLTGYQWLEYCVSIVKKNWNLAQRVELPQPLWLNISSFLWGKCGYFSRAYLVHQLGVDDVIVNILSIETENCSLSVGTESHVDQCHSPGSGGECWKIWAHGVMITIHVAGALASCHVH